MRPFLLNVHTRCCSQQHLSLSFHRRCSLRSNLIIPVYPFRSGPTHYLTGLAHQRSSSPYSPICALLSQLGFLRIARPRHRQSPSPSSEPAHSQAKAQPSHQGTMPSATSRHHNHERNTIILVSGLNDLWVFCLPRLHIQPSTKPDFKSEKASRWEWGHRF